MFRLDLAHALFARLLGTIEPVLKDKRHLLVVPSGPLTSFHLLVTEKPAEETPKDRRGRPVVRVDWFCIGSLHLDARGLGDTMD